MAKNKSGINISFGLKSFEILSSSFEKKINDFNEEKLGYQVQFRPTLERKSCTVSIEMSVRAIIGKDAEQIVGSIRTLTSYHLSNLDKIKKNDEEYLLPKGIAVTLLSIALSTTRGAFAAKSEGSILADYVMPLINPEDMYEASPLKGSIEIK